MTNENSKNDNTYLTLTDTDRKILASYKAMLPNLGEYLGEGYEIILHSLENLQHSVIENVNGHYSGRGNGSPITDYALSMLARLEHDNGDQRNGGKNLNNGENEMQNFHISSNFHASVPVPSADGKL